MFKFSKQLKQKLKQYLFKKHGAVVSDDELNSHLSSLSDLYALLSKN